MLADLNYRNLDDEPSLAGQQHHHRGARPAGRRPARRPRARRPRSGRRAAELVRDRGHPARVPRRVGELRAGAVTCTVHVVVPDGVDDPARPSGGNVYDRRLVDELARGWAGRCASTGSPGTSIAAGCWPTLPDGAVVLVDGLVGVRRAAMAARGRPAAARRAAAHAARRGAAERGRAADARATRVVTTSALGAGRGCSTHHGLDRGPGAGRGARASTRGRWSPDSAAGGELLCVGPVTPDKGHDVLLDALRELRDLDWRCTLRRRARPRPRRSSPARGVADGPASPTGCAFTGPLVRRPTSTLRPLDADLRRVGVPPGVLRHGRDRGAGPRYPGRRDGRRRPCPRRSAPTRRPGVLVPPDDAGALAAALRRWLTEPGSRDRLRRRGRRGGDRWRHWPGPRASCRRRLNRQRSCPYPRPARTAADGWERPSTHDVLAPGSGSLAGVAILAVLVLPARRRAVPRRAPPHRRGRARCVALVVTAGTTWCCAWRWSLLAERLDVAVPVRTAYRAYYRSQFLNATLPGGVLGDVHRGDPATAATSGALGRGLRSVVWDRASGQVGAGRAAGRCSLLAAACPDSAARLGARWRLARSPSPWSRVRSCGRAELRRVLRAGVWPGSSLASALAAARARARLRGRRRARWASTAPLPELVPLALVVLARVRAPAERRRLGPARGRGRLGLRRRRSRARAPGSSVAVVYGVMSLVATLPGLLTLLAGGYRSATPSRDPSPRRPPWLTAPTPCSAAACRSTATSTAPTDERLLLSNDADFDRVDEVRAGCDAILVGAATVRNDNPRLLVRAEAPASHARGRGRPARHAGQGDA